MRKNKFKGNFLELIAEDIETITTIESGLRSKNLSTEKLQRAKSAIVDLRLFIDIARYSSSSSKEDIKLSILETISAFERGFNFHPGDMDTLHWLISMSILCNIDLEDFKRITKVLERDKVQDKLLDFLIKYKQTDWQGVSENFIQKTPYAELRQAIDETDSENGIKQLQVYLKNKWYQGHDKMEAAWVDSHLNKKVNTYFGYWAWETAALVKAKNWDDEKLKDMDYYPYDAVHW